MDRTQELDAFATVAGLRDPDMLRLAKDDLPPKDAVLDLVRRYRGAFHAEQCSQFEQSMQPKKYSQMTPEDQDEFCRKHKLPSQHEQPKLPKQFETMTLQEQAAFYRKHNMPQPNRGTSRGTGRVMQIFY
jgi:hypothetical protein